MSFSELLNTLMPPAERMRWEACLAHHAREYARNSDVVREGAIPEKMHVVLAGWAQRYKQLEDGRRQILGFILPGEVCNLDLFTMMRADHSIAAVRTLTVAEIDRDEIERLLHDCPHLSELFCLGEIIAKSQQHEWILSLGQRVARQPDAARASPRPGGRDRQPPAVRSRFRCARAGRRVRRSLSARR